jgi:hypothetical protein
MMGLHPQPAPRLTQIPWDSSSALACSPSSQIDKKHPNDNQNKLGEQQLIQKPVLDQTAHRSGLTSE